MFRLPLAAIVAASLLLVAAPLSACPVAVGSSVVVQSGGYCASSVVQSAVVVPQSVYVQSYVPTVAVQAFAVDYCPVAVQAFSVRQRAVVRQSAVVRQRVVVPRVRSRTVVRQVIR